MLTESMSPQHRYDLDWLRVLAILAVFVFHSGRFFDQMGWHVKSATVYAGVQAWTMFLSSWLMPMIFIISGASLFYAIGHGSAAGFVRDKGLRLFVPLVVGVFTHVAIGVYLERITQHQFSGSFFAFYPHYFDGLYGFGGNFAWRGLHLWYLLVLFVFSLGLYRLLRLLKGPGRAFLDALGNFLAAPGAIFILILPVAWLYAVVDPRSFWGHNHFGGWPLPAYLLYLLYGFVIFSHERLRERIRQTRRLHLAGAVVASAFLLWRFGYAVPQKQFPALAYFGVFYVVGAWCWMLAFIGFGINSLTCGGPFLRRANEAVLPFYIMHQTVLLVLGYLILPCQIPDPVKWLLIAACSFALILGLYEFAVRRFNILRVLFGMRALPAERSFP